jgi:hypothetical protein
VLASTLSRVAKAEPVEADVLALDATEAGRLSLFLDPNGCQIVALSNGGILPTSTAVTVLDSSKESLGASSIQVKGGAANAAYVGLALFESDAPGVGETVTYQDAGYSWSGTEWKSARKQVVAVQQSAFRGGAMAEPEPAAFRGSDTLFGAVTAAISSAELTQRLKYLAGGSGRGETGLVAGTQGIAPMSRLLSTASEMTLFEQGVIPIQEVIGLDGVSLFVAAAQPVPQMTLATIRAIYTCQITDWSMVPGSGNAGPIVAYALDGYAGTTDVFKQLVGGLPATTSAGDTVRANWPPCIRAVGTTARRAHVDRGERDRVRRAIGEPIHQSIARDRRRIRRPVHRTDRGHDPRFLLPAGASTVHDLRLRGPVAG